MSAREFRDSQGRDWRAWDVIPDNLNSRIKNEDFLAALNYTGWVVFETRNESEKRRLYPIPKGWSELPDPELEALLERAERVPARRLRGELGDDETAR
jgi:ABC-type Fe3+ transport system substrate-binding protein